MNIIFARKLHERRFRPNPVMTTGELLALIGDDGLREALNSRFLVPDMDSGFLTLNLHGSKLAELESACRCGACGKTDCGCSPVAETGQVSTMPMREAFAAFGVSRPGNPTDSTQPTPMLRTPDPTPTQQVPSNPKQYRVGDPAAVQQDNVTYKGEISSFEPDGRIRMRWSGQRPPNERSYGPGEFLVTDEKPGANA